VGVSVLGSVMPVPVRLMRMGMMVALATEAEPDESLVPHIQPSLGVAALLTDIFVISLNSPSWVRCSRVAGP